MREDQLLEAAISAARAGHELTARDLFLEVVQINAQNEVAWMWLTGLLDHLDDCIYACEKVLEINPLNENARGYLAKLRARKLKERETEKLRLRERLQETRELAEAGKKKEALDCVNGVVTEDPANADAWELLARLSTDLNEQIRALEKLSQLRPGDSRAGQELTRLRHFRHNPLDLAALYEEQGDLDRAIATYQLAMVNLKSKSEWDSIYWKITRLENLRQENIAHISPTISLARLTAGPPVLYLLLMIVQLGFNPIAEPAVLLWFGFLWVVLGGFLIALASVRSRHPLWSVLFKDAGSRGSRTARTLVALAGWFLVLLPHILLVVVAFNRLINYTISLIP